MAEKPDKEAYRRALAEARAREFAIRIKQVRDIQAAVERFADGLARRLQRLDPEILARLTSSRQLGLQRAEQIAREAAREMLEVIEKSVRGHRRAAYNEVLKVWQNAQVKITEAERAAFTLSTPLPSLPLLGIFEAVNSPYTWRTLTRQHAGKAAGEVALVMRQGFAEGVDPMEMSRRLRGYVEGSERLEHLFRNVRTDTGIVKKIDLRSIPPELQGAAQQMRYNAERIAVSENHNAKWEAEVQAHIEDPFTEAVAWELSPGHDDYDECDALSDGDFYGLGPGVYPVDAVPSPPHPFCGCSTQAVLRDRPKGKKPKPPLNFGPIYRPPGMSEARYNAITAHTARALYAGAGMLAPVMGDLSGTLPESERFGFTRPVHQPYIPSPDEERLATIMARAAGEEVERKAAGKFLERVVAAAESGALTVPQIQAIKALGHRFSKVAPLSIPPDIGDYRPGPDFDRLGPQSQADIDGIRAASRELMEIIENLSKDMGGDVSKVELFAPVGMFANADYTPDTDVIRLGPRSTEQLLDGLIRLIETGTLGPADRETYLRTFEGYSTLLHEHTHSVTFKTVGQDWRQRSQYNDQESARFIEEGLVELNARRLSFASALGEQYDRPPPPEGSPLRDDPLFHAYAPEVDVVLGLEKMLGKDVIDTLFENIDWVDREKILNDEIKRVWDQRERMAAQVTRYQIDETNPAGPLLPVYGAEEYIAPPTFDQLRIIMQGLGTRNPEQAMSQHWQNQARDLGFDPAEPPMKQDPRQFEIPLATPAQPLETREEQEARGAEIAQAIEDERREREEEEQRGSIAARAIEKGLERQGVQGFIEAAKKLDSDHILHIWRGNKDSIGHGRAPSRMKLSPEERETEQQLVDMVHKLTDDMRAGALGTVLFSFEPEKINASASYDPSGKIIHIGPDASRDLLLLIADLADGKNPTDSQIEALQSLVHENYHSITYRSAIVSPDMQYSREESRFIEEGLVELWARRQTWSAFRGEEWSLRDSDNEAERHGPFYAYNPEVEAMLGFEKLLGSETMDRVMTAGSWEAREAILSDAIRDVWDDKDRGGIEPPSLEVILQWLGVTVVDGQPSRDPGVAIEAFWRAKVREAAE